MSRNTLRLPAEELVISKEVDVLVAGGGPLALLRLFRRQGPVRGPC